MKQMILILALMCITTYSHAQESKEKYSEYTACNECNDKWETTGFENYTFSTHSKKESETKQQTKRFIGGILTVFVSAISFLIFNLTNKAIYEIH